MVRLDAFGAANYIGLLSGAVLVLLVTLSSDAALRRFSAARWKRFQQLNYLGAVALVFHGVLYRFAEGRHWRLMLVFSAVISATVCPQTLGTRAVRRLRSQPKRACALGVSLSAWLRSCRRIR